MWQEMWRQFQEISAMSSIRSAEFLLATIKLTLGIEILLSSVGPHPRGVLDSGVGILIGLAFLFIAFLQGIGVLRNFVRFRQWASVLATGVWLYFMGIIWWLTGTPQNVLVYIPLLAFNILLFMRLSKLPFSKKRVRARKQSTHE